MPIKALATARTAGLKRGFERDGFAVVRGLYPQALLDRMRRRAGRDLAAMAE